jgi:uncharacterized protein
MIALLGYPAALLIGVSLGLIGAGGAVLTIPVLVYMFNVPAHLATTYSLFVVGLSAASGSIGYVRNNLLSYKTALAFGGASLTAVFLTRKFIFHLIPEQLQVLGIHISKDKLILLLFAIVMLIASYSMIRTPRVIVKDKFKRVREHGKLFLILNGLAVGFLAGMVGAGGGFLIIPALVVIQELPMKIAIGTSLLIIAVNSFIGFAGDLGHVTIDWSFLGLISILAFTGILIGLAIGKRISGPKLKPIFGWFILLMGVYIIAKSY